MKGKLFDSEANSKSGGGFACHSDCDWRVRRYAKYKQLLEGLSAAKVERFSLFDAAPRR